MAGKLDLKTQSSAFLTPWKLRRSDVGDGSGTYAETMVELVALDQDTKIDMCGSISAHTGNTLAVLVSKTNVSPTGSGVNITVYGTLSEGALAGTTIELAHEEGISADTIIYFYDLYASNLMIGLDTLDNNVFDIYTSHAAAVVTGFPDMTN